jgi:hypothetical protein
MTLEKLRALARKLLGPGHARLRTKAALVAALEQAARKAKQVAQKVGKGRAPPTRAPRGEKRASVTRKTTKEATKKARKKATRPGAPARARARAVPTPPPARERPADEGSLDPAAFFVARVRGEEAVRGAPYPMAEGAAGAPLPVEATGGAPPDEPGELPWSYGEDALVVLPRDPRTLFVYWDHAESTLREGFRDLEAPRVELWLYARAGDGWERVRRVPLALESRGYYVHGVDAGRTYRAELRVVDRAGRERLLGPGSGDAEVPPAGPSPIVDDRFERLTWDQPLGPPLGPGHRGPDFPADAREDLARLSGVRGEAGEGAPRPGSPGGGPPWGPGEGDR